MARGGRRRWGRALALGLVVAAIALVLAPAGPVALPPSPGQPRLWRGAYHVHSTQSDGSGSPAEIARAAADAGLDFVILTDHGDGTRAPAPPRYVDDVLLIDAVEISTDDGHYVALNLPQADYPLAGEGRAVADDVRRLGGIGIVAHPDSPRASLAWHDWSADADGFEWVNADSTWRGAGTGHLLARFFTYPLNGPAALAALASHPDARLAERDTPSNVRAPRLALAAVDAHARIGWRRDADPIEGGRTLARFPSYRAMFGTFGLVVPWTSSAPGGTAALDARLLLQAIAQGGAYGAVFSMADAPWLSIELAGHPSGAAAGHATLLVRSNAPAGAVLRVRRNGRAWRETTVGTATFDLDARASAGIFRAELWLPRRRGWPDLPVAISQAVGHNLPSPPPSPAPVRVEPMAITGWHVEHDPRSAATRSDVPGALASATMTLAGGHRVSQFAALVADLGPPPPGASGIALDIEADAPMRVSVQWREPRPGEGLRWRHSAYVDGNRRRVDLPIASFRPIRPADGTAPMGRIHALLFVMDTVNARPGDRRALTIHAAGWTFAR